MEMNKENIKNVKLLIIGGGAAGYTSAIYAARALLDPVLLLGLNPGGQLTLTYEVDNFPGFAETVEGPNLMAAMHAQAQRLGTIMEEDYAIGVDFTSTLFKVYTKKGFCYQTQSVIIATGATAKWLGLESEAKYIGYGVSACATCDGFFFKNKKVMVVGGGNSAVEEALFLARLASEVVLVHRRDSLRADQTNQRKLLSNPKVKVIWNSVVDEVLGTEDPKTVTGVRIKNVNTGATQTVDVNGLFVAIGHTPQTVIFRDQISLDVEGYVMVDRGGVRTSIPGIFAAGDVHDKVYRQAITAAGFGCMAALEAEKYLSN